MFNLFWPPKVHLKAKIDLSLTFIVQQLLSADTTMCRNSNFVLILPKKTTLKSRILQQNCINLQYCQNRPSLPRRLKTHIDLSMFPILRANLYLDHRGISSHIKVESFGKVDANDRSKELQWKGQEAVQDQVLEC